MLHFYYKRFKRFLFFFQAPVTLILVEIEKLMKKLTPALNQTNICNLFYLLLF